MAEITATVSVETVVARILKETAEALYKEHGVVLESVDFSWHRVIDGNRLSNVAIHLRQDFP